MRGRGEGEREGRRGGHAVLMLDFLLMRSHWWVKGTANKQQVREDWSQQYMETIIYECTHYISLILCTLY